MGLEGKKSYCSELLTLHPTAGQPAHTQVCALRFRPELRVPAPRSRLASPRAAFQITSRSRAPEKLVTSVPTAIQGTGAQTPLSPEQLGPGPEAALLGPPPCCGQSQPAGRSGLESGRLMDFLDGGLQSFPKISILICTSNFSCRLLFRFYQKCLRKCLPRNPGTTFSWGGVPRTTLRAHHELI